MSTFETALKIGGGPLSAGDSRRLLHLPHSESTPDDSYLHMHMHSMIVWPHDYNAMTILSQHTTNSQL